MTVAENVEYGMRVQKVPAAERAHARHRSAGDGPAAGLRVAQAGRAVGRPAPAGGAGAVDRQPPRVLLLDEPLGALDLKLREQMQVELKGIQSEVGITFIYVTHDQDEALTMSDRIAVFNEGRVEQVGAPAEIYERPATRFVSGFVGISNVLERDGKRFTVRPEKIRLLEPTEDERRTAHRARRDPGRRLRGDGDPLPGPARRWRGASSRPPEPRDVLRGGARAGGSKGGRRMAA